MVTVVVVVEVWEVHVVEGVVRVFGWKLVVVLLGSRGSKTPVAAEAVEYSGG